MFVRNPHRLRPKLSDPIEKLEMHVRTRNLLNNANISTVRDLIAKRPSEIIKLRNCGYGRLLEIQAELATRGYKLSEDVSA